MNNYIGIDIGFGDTKIVSNQGFKKFPTAIAPAPVGGVDLGSFGKAMKKYLYNGQYYIIGEEAVASALPTRDINFLLEFSPLILQHVQKVYQAFDTVALGLPLAYFKQSKELKSIIEQTLQLEVSVIPQGMGVLFDYTFDDETLKVKNNIEDCLVVDIGFNTIDVLAVQQGKPVREYSSCLESSGVVVIAQLLSDYINKHFNDVITEQECKQILMTQYYKEFGNKHNLSPFIRKCTLAYADRLLSTLSDKWGKLLKRMDKFLIAGGGAYYLQDSIPDKYIRMAEIVRPGQSEFANAAGFYKFLENKYGKNNI